MTPSVPKESRFVALRAVRRAVSLSLSARTVYWELDDLAGYRAHCWPKETTLATCCGISVRAVRDGLRELEARGLLTTVRRDRGLEFFLAWGDRQNLPLMIGKICRSDRQNLPLTGAVSINEQNHEQRKEQRCSFCGGSGVTGTSGADIAVCACAEGAALENLRRRMA